MSDACQVPLSSTVSRRITRQSSAIDNEFTDSNTSPLTSLSTSSTTQYDKARHSNIKDQPKRKSNKVKNAQLEEDMQLALKLHAELNSGAESRRAARSAQRKISSTFSKPSQQSEGTKDKGAKKQQWPRVKKSTEAINDSSPSHELEPPILRRRPPRLNLQKVTKVCISSQAHGDVEEAIPSDSHGLPKPSLSPKSNPKRTTLPPAEPSEAHRDETTEGDEATEQELGFETGDDTVIRDNLTSSEDESTAYNSPIQESNRERITDTIDCKCGLPIDFGKAMICCDNCHTWQHNQCMGIPNTEIDGDYLCNQCDFKVLCLVHLQDNQSELYASNRSSLKKYVLAWRERGRTDVFKE